VVTRTGHEGFRGSSVLRKESERTRSSRGRTARPRQCGRSGASTSVDFESAAQAAQVRSARDPAGSASRRQQARYVAAELAGPKLVYRTRQGVHHRASGTGKRSKRASSLSRTGARIYVSTGRRDGRDLDAATLTGTATIRSVSGPGNMAVTRTEKKLYVACGKLVRP